MQLLNQLKNRLNHTQFQIGEDRSVFLICILIASIFWLLVKLSESYSIEKDIFLSFSHPEDQAFLNSPPDKLSAKVEGTGWDLMYDYFLRPNTRLFYVLENQRNLLLTQSRLLNDINSNLSEKDLKLKDFSCDAIDLKLEDKVEKVVPIRLVDQIEFDPQSGYRLKGSVQKYPTEVTITGPISIVKEQSHWKTDSIIEYDLKRSVERLVHLQAPPAELALSINQVQVIIPVEQYTERSFFVKVQVVNAPDSIKIFPEQIKLTCVVGLSQYNQLRKEDFTLEANFKGIEVDNQRNTVPISLKEYPPYVKNVFYSPKSAEFFLIKEVAREEISQNLPDQPTESSYQQ